MTPPLEPSSPHDGGIRKRVCKACDRCRLKKSKCDGASPCSRCKADNAICVFGERKKSHDKVYPKGYVEMLESQQAQLVTGLQELYRLVQNNQGWAGAPLKETGSGTPLTHDILEALGALKQDGNTTHESFEEDLNALQQRLIDDGAGFMQRQPSHGSHSDISAPSPIYEPVAQRPNFTNPFSLNQLPPTPPNRSPYPQNARAVPPTKSHSYPHTVNLQSNLSWTTPVGEFDTSMDFVNQFGSPMVDSSFDLTSFPSVMSQDHIVPAAINPCLTMKDWAGQEDLQRYFNPTMLA
ncbi:Fluconazole resistance protein 1 [Exophiala xenobiotica]|nr:Fluconazole resistance protein 1 [Exophiala xenobiotica]